MENSPNGPSKRTITLFVVIGILFIAAIAITTLAILKGFNKPEEKTESTPTTVTVIKTPLIRPQLVATGLARPVVISSTTDTTDKRLFIVEQPGRIMIINSNGSVETKPFLDITAKVLSDDGEMGLLGLTFHPNYKQNGYFYINYIDKSQSTVIARYHVSTDKNVADPASEKVLLTLKQPYDNHNGGDLVFGKDGYLYAALGDGGSAGDPQNRAQNKNTLLGKILRLDVNKGDPYSIPDSNPFVGQGNAKPEIWAYGLRNPWRISFDAKTNDLYIADVGQGAVEEINRQKADSKGGENYGWRCYEGSKPFNTDGCPTSDSLVIPIVQYPRGEQNGCAVVGGYVYRGMTYPSLDGKYFYGDYCSGKLWYTSLKDGTWDIVEAAETPYSISTFGQDSRHELYFADLKTGSIYQIEDAAK